MNPLDMTFIEIGRHAKAAAIYHWRRLTNTNKDYTTFQTGCVIITYLTTIQLTDRLTTKLGG